MNFNMDLPEDVNSIDSPQIAGESLLNMKTISINKSEENLSTPEIDIAKAHNLTSGCQSPEKIIPVTKVNDDKLAVKKEEMSPGKKKLYTRLNKQMKIEMTDGRVLVGIFLCTDRDANVILGSCTEYLNPEVCGFTDEPRILGLVMVPGRHIVSIHHDATDSQLMYIPEEKDSKQI